MTRITLALLLAACGDDSTPGVDSGTARDGGGTRDSGGSTADSGGGTDGGGGSDSGGSDSGMRSTLSFFITSVGLGDGANLGGLDGADAHCQMLAEAVGAGDRMWRAYLSNSDPEINARDRIGTGPWLNADGEMIAADVAELHGENNLNGMTGLTEAGDTVNGVGDDPNQHDILTGSTAEGMADPGSTCMNWTGNDEGNARLGHHDRMGGSPATGMSWNSAHDSRGCSQSDLEGTGGAGLFYCFAAD
jgi:hypothetical protein